MNKISNKRRVFIKISSEEAAHTVLIVKIALLTIGRGWSFGAIFIKLRSLEGSRLKLDLNCWAVCWAASMSQSAVIALS